MDVIVAGGGPIGLAAAIEARLAGLSVLVCEPRSAPVDKACGEGLMPGAVKALSRLGVSPQGIALAGIAYLDRTHRVEHRFRAGPGSGVRRTELHRALHERARGLDVGIAPAAVKEFQQNAAGVTVSTSIGTSVRSQWLLACDGLHSPTRRKLGLSDAPRSGQRFGLRRHYAVPPWSEFVEVHWAPGAEIYVTPVAPDAVGVAVLGSREVGYEQVLRGCSTLSERLSGVRPCSALRGAGPLRQRAVRPVAGRVLLVGDAAGYVDALTGEGVRVGLAQARAAVRAVQAGDAQLYERSWSRLTRDYRLITTMLLAAANRPKLRNRIVPLAARLPRTYGAIVDRLAD